jgi:hypothetical protein
MSDTPEGGWDSGPEGFAPPDGGSRATDVDFAPPAGSFPGRAAQSYPYPAYSSGYYGPPMLRKQTSGLAVAGMVLGILSLLLFWASLLAPLLAVLGITFSVIGLSQSSKPGWTGTGMAVAGMVCSLVTLAIWVALVVVVSSLIA